VLLRADSAGATHTFVDHVHGAGVRFSVGFPITARVRDAIRGVDDKDWVPAVRQDGALRDGAAAAELTAAVDLSGWPAGSRLIVRREPLHPGAQQTLDDIDGARFTCFLTDQTDTDLAALDVRHRAHARVEDRIRGAKNTGARTLPCNTLARNAVWLQLVLAAQDLMTFMQALTLDGALRVAEPPTPSLPTAPRPRPHHDHRAQTHPADRTDLAVGRPPRRRVHPATSPPAARDVTPHSQPVDPLTTDHPHRGPPRR